MKVIEAIVQLTKILLVHGNLEICAVVEYEEGIALELDKVFEMIEVAETEDGKTELKLCALMDPMDFDHIPEKPKLTVVK